jgi:threonine dehydrogenase-like Zn-dependent dehydrogenase
VRVDDLITHTYSPANAPQAYEMLQTDRASAMGVLLDFRQL